MKRFSLFAIILFLALAPLFVFAQQQNPPVVQINPNLPGSHDVTKEGIGGLIDNFYQFALMIGGVIAFGAIVFGGVKYAASAGNPTAQHDGKEWIQSALLGLVLLASAYLILRTINPDLVNLGLPNAAPVDLSGKTPTNSSTNNSNSNCAVNIVNGGKPCK